MLGDEGLEVDGVGPWAKEKHARLRKYVDISRAVRRKFLQRSGSATYIDLFCGSGEPLFATLMSKLTVVRSSRSNLHVMAEPISEIHIADLHEEKVAAAAQRITKAGGRATTYVGKAEDVAAKIVAQPNPHGLHFAFLICII